MELTRRQFIQSVITASAASVAPFSYQACAKEEGKSYMAISLGWGFEDDQTLTPYDMAQKVIAVMDEHTARYNILKWVKEPEWKQYTRRNREVYKMSCEAMVEMEDGRPVYRSIL